MYRDRNSDPVYYPKTNRSLMTYVIRISRVFCQLQEVNKAVSPQHFNNSTNFSDVVSCNCVCSTVRSATRQPKCPTACPTEKLKVCGFNRCCWFTVNALSDIRALCPNRERCSDWPARLRDRIWLQLFGCPSRLADLLITHTFAHSLCGSYSRHPDWVSSKSVLSVVIVVMVSTFRNWMILTS